MCARPAPRRRPALLALALLLAGCGHGLRAGAAAVDITPERPTPLAGYGARLGRPSTGIHDRVMAKALYLESGATRVALVTADLIGSLRRMRDDVRARLPSDLHVILAASHTHSGPGGLVETADLRLLATVGRYDPELYAWMRDRLVSVVRRAMEESAPADVRFGSGQAPEYCRNRRSEHYEGVAPTDPELGVLRIGEAVVVNYSAHPTVLDADNMMVSADWPGALQRRLETAGGVALFTNGAEGDLSPRSPGGADDFDKCGQMGAALAARVREVPLRSQGDSLRYVEREVQLPDPRGLKWARSTVLGVLAVGEAALVCVPGELACELGLEIKRRFRALGFEPVWIVGLANDHLFYILSEDQYRRGGYERTMSFYGPGLGAWMADQFEALGRKLTAP